MLVRPGGKVRVAAALLPLPIRQPTARRISQGRPVVNLSELFIRRPVMTVALTVSVILFGVLAYFQLPVSDLPAVDYPVIQVQVNYPGATPETMANNVATPLERQFMQIPGLELVTSNNSQGHTSFVLQFDLSQEPRRGRDRRAGGHHARLGQLPVDLPSPPTFTKTNPNDQPIMYIALVSDTVTEGQLYDYANTQVGERISILPGVSQVAVYGTQSAVRIKADPSEMAIRNITIEDLTNAIKNGTSYTGAGQFDGPHRTFPAAAAGAADDRRAIQQSDRRPNQRRAGLSEGRRQRQARRAGRAHRHALLGARLSASPAQPWWSPYSAGPARMRSKCRKSVRDVLPSIQTQLPSSVLLVPAYDRSQDHRRQHQGRADDAVHRVRAGGDGDLRLPGPRDRHADSCRGVAAVAAADVHRDEAAGLQPRQSFADGADAGHRVPGGRCDRVPGKHRAPDGRRA